MTSDSFTSATAWPIVIDRSYWTWTFSVGGSPFSISSSFSFTRCAISTVFVPGCRCTIQIDRPLAVVVADRLVVLDVVEHVGDVAEADRRAIAIGNDQAAELRRIVHLAGRR